MTSYLEQLLEPALAGTILIAAVYGLFVGAIPGLTATMAVALLLPLTLFLDEVANVPLAEQAGLQPLIDRLVLQRTCARSKALNEGIFTARPALAHVNLSPLTIREPEFVANLAHDLEHSGLDPDQLVLEIT